jgi:AraC-like DNA-binding protein
LTGVRTVHQDARGIVAPTAGLTKFGLNRYQPGEPANRFVDRYWIATWDLTAQNPHRQQVLAHPVVNLIFGDGPARVVGVTTRMTVRTLAGRGRVLGIMFRPAGFRPFLGRAMSTATDRVFPLVDVFGLQVRAVDRAICGAVDEAEIVAEAESFLGRLCPADAQASEAVTAIVEEVARDQTLRRVDAVAAAAGLSVRTLQRLFAEHVGVSPKTVIRRYRIYEAAERARAGARVDWATLAPELGYSDQAHLVRDFAAAFGMPPERYARQERR